MSARTGIQKVLALYDNSPTKVAAALGEPVQRQHVEHWLRAGRVPAERCPLIERATNGRIRCEDLRPDVAWDVLRMQAGEACHKADPTKWDGKTERRRSDKPQARAH
jgi:DNA-binding transcriptional regulator YdaS (Cro superfamily)